MEMNGFVKIYRDILDDPVITKDAEHLAVYVYLMLTATHKEFPTWFNGKKVILKPGQLITSSYAISQALKGVSESKAKRILKVFESEQLIGRQTRRHGTLISLLFWESEIKSGQPNGQLMDNQWTTSGQPVDCKQEGKEGKKKRIYIEDEKVNAAVVDFIRHRKSIKKPMTDRAVELFIKRLKELSTDPETQVRLIEQSIERGWQTVYPLKDDKPNNKFNRIIEHDYDFDELERKLLHG